MKSKFSLLEVLADMKTDTTDLTNLINKIADGLLVGRDITQEVEDLEKLSVYYNENLDRFKRYSKIIL